MIRMLKTAAVERLEAELRATNEQRATLGAEIARLDARLGDLEDEGQIVSAWAAVQAARNRQKKLDGRAEGLQARLDVAKDEARARRRQELLAKFAAAAPEFIAKARALQSAMAQLVDARDALAAEGFHQEHAALPIPPAVNGSALAAPALISMFETALKPAVAVAMVVPAPRAAQPPPANPRSHRVSLADPPTPRPPKPPLRRETAGDGEKLFSVHRGGSEHPRKGQLQTGDVVALTEAEALPLLRAGVGDFVSADELPALDASAANAGFRVMEAAQ